MIDLQALRRYGERAGRTKGRGAACDLCGVPTAADHGHVVDLERRVICCACRACALLFEEPGAAQGRYRTIPGRILFDPAFTLTEEIWSRLQIPVRLAFIFFSSKAKRWVAFYPSPAGATESDLALEAFEALRSMSRLARAVEPDVEALIAYAPRNADTYAWFLVPIDRCYALVGRIRRAWSGFDGGRRTEAEIARFFQALEAKGRPVGDPGGRP